MSTRSKGDGSVFQLASGKWRGQVEAGFTPAGARRYRTVTGDTKADAVRKLRALQNKIAKEGVAAAPAALTVKRWSDTWLPIYQQTVRPTRYTDVRGVLRRYIVPTIGHKRLTALTPADVRAVHKATAAAGMGPHTALRSHDVLMVMLKAAMQEGAAVPANVLGVKRPQPGEPDRDAIPLPHALAILQAASSRPDASKWAAAFLQGLRQGERLGLTWECVDLDKGLIDVSWQLQRLPYDDREAGTFRVPVGFTARQLVGAAHLVRPKSRKGWRATRWCRGCVMRCSRGRRRRRRTRTGWCGRRTAGRHARSRTPTSGGRCRTRRACGMSRAGTTTGTRRDIRRRPCCSSWAWTRTR